MPTEGRDWIDHFRIKWITTDLIRTIAVSLSIALILSAVLIYPLHLSPWLFVALFPFICAIGLFLKPIWKITAVDVSRYMNNNYPELEESAELLLKNPAELSQLQQLQSAKIERLLPSLTLSKTPTNKLYASLLILLSALLMSFAIAKIPSIGENNAFVQEKKHGIPVKEEIPAEIKDFSVTIYPPPYTKKAVRKQEQFTITAETGAKVAWQIETTLPIKKMRLIFNDREIFLLKPTNKELTQWAFAKQVDQSGFYQLELDGQKSELYPIHIVPDLPVDIKIGEPKPHTTIDIGEPQKINLKVTLSDDYGISDAFISATMASGKGEGVSFTEKKIAFDRPFNNQQNLSLSKAIDLKSLGMKPGDELYFFVKATDNHGQSSRSDIYFVTIADTAALMSMADMASGVSLIPEYFRSQRQIIIDTEKLLKEQGTLTIANFNARSNELGIDQKLLRLKYGQFLGEENETEIGGDGHDDHEAGTQKFGDVSSIVDQYAHKHDIAEDATFFEPEQKAQLKAVLTEMWNSELQLRTYRPKTALPYAYKALRLLKDLQQKSRVYVAKTTVKPAALKPEKRLSGELDKITQPVQKMSFEQKEQRIVQLQTALTLLEDKKASKKLNQNDQFVLNQAEKYMIGAAADQPSSYLNALSCLRRITSNNKWKAKDIDVVQQAIQKMINLELPKPQNQNASPASALYQTYFNNLNKAGK